MESYILIVIRHDIGYGGGWGCCGGGGSPNDKKFNQAKATTEVVVGMLQIKLKRDNALENSICKMADPTVQMASFTKEVNPRLAKRPLKTNGRLANRGLTSLVKEATAGVHSYS